MAIFYFLIIILMLIGIKNKVGKNCIFEDYIGKTQCNAIKGIFILVVFMRHVVPYVKNSGYEMSTCLDRIFILIDGHIGQLLVVMFLFYSGYGVMASISKNGVAYIDDIPKKRVLTTFLNFDVAVGFFLLMNFVLGIKIETEQYFFARLGWESIGNSNWYIFIIMLCYIFTYFSYKLLSSKWSIILIIMLAIAVIYLYTVKSPWWYNTVLSYPAGIIYYKYKVRIDLFIKKRYTITLIGLLFLLLIIHLINIKLSSILLAYTYNIEGIVFALLVVTLTMKIMIGNKVLYWLGVNLFPLYIYQRLPMILMRETMGIEWLAVNPYLFCLISLVGTILITYIYRFFKISI